MQLFFRQFSSSNKTIKPITQQNHTANHTAETQRHVVDACIRSLPLTTTHEDHLGGGAYCYSGESLRRLNRINRRGDENKEIVPKKGYTTSVFFWKWFGYLESDQALQTSVRCKICRRPVLSRTADATELFDHLKRFHPTEHSESVI